MSEKKGVGLVTTAAVLSGFFVMGIVDLIGVITNQAKQDFQLTDTVAGFLPSAVFIWFFVCSLPSGLLMNRIGRKNTVLLSYALTLIALALAFVCYTKTIVFIALALLGIGNAVIQVAMSPLVSGVVRKDRLTSCLTLGQVFKAATAISGPFFVGIASASGNWKIVLPCYALFTLIAGIWLWFTQIPNDREAVSTTSFGDCLKLLVDPRIFVLFMGIVMVVGFDVGANVYTSAEKTTFLGMPLASVYFAAKTGGAFLGAFLLTKIAVPVFFRASVMLMLIAMALLFKAGDASMIGISILLASLGASNIFAMIFGYAMQDKPDHANEVSGLLVMGITGGALIPPIMGVAKNSFGTAGIIAVLAACGIYLLVLAVLYKPRAVK